ncbi:MAG: Hemolysin-type calcium-binding region, partial [Gammaproteobacteria bacterium]|nr:Hemolysin-type calcium-binding region [Gammaproteobacteria bacterium]
MSYIKAGSEFLVNTVTADFQEMPSLTTLSNGGFVVSWHSNNQASASSGMDIYAQVFAADGTKVGSDFLVNTFTPREQSQAVLAALSNGGFVVSWQSTHQVSSTSSRDIYAQAFTANGTKVGGEFLVNTFTTGAQAKPTLTALSDGGFVVSWNSENQVSGSSSYDIYAQVFAADGTKVGSEFLVNTFTNSEQIDPNLTALSDGGFVVSWMSYNQLSGSSHYDIYAQLCAADGTKVGSEFLVNAFTTGAQSSPALTALRGGGFVASWQSNNQANGSSGMDIYAQLFTANGTKVGSEFLVNTFTNNEQSNPTLTTLSDGGFIVSWQSTHQVSSTSARDIYAQAFTANGTKVGSEFLVNTFTPREQAEPTLTALSDGGFVVSWMSQNQVSGSSFLDIYAQRFITTTPRLRLSQSTLSFTEDGAPVALDSGLTVSDSDSTTLAYATVTISTGLVAGEDELLFGNQNGISGSYTNGVLSLNGIASLANYQTALRSVRYRNTNNQNPNTGARTISITVNDGVEDSNTVSLGLSVVAVNDVPIITTSSGSVSFTEKGAAIVIDSGLTVSDVDNAQLTRASIAITVGYVLGEDKLLFTAQNGISGSFNVSSGLLTLTGGSSVANYQAALRSVTYINTSDHPNTQARTISFIVNDGQADSPAANRSINVIAVNNAPVITTSSGSVSFTEQGAAVILDNGLTVSDVDNTQLVNATASISQGFVTQEDELGFTALAGIAGHYDSQQGVLSLTGIANSNDYQTALRSVTYRNRNTVNPNTQPRTVEFVVNDGALTSAAANRTVTVIAVNDAPVIVNNQLTVGQAQTVVLSTSQLSASDDTTPANTLQFTVSNVQHGQFRLMSAAATSFTQQAITEGKVSFVHDGTATAPSYTVIVSDGSLTSSAQAASITFNAAPILVNNQLTIGQAQTVVLTTSQLSASDDNALANALQFTVSDVQRGQFRLMSAAATSFTQQDIIDGKVTFVQDGTATAPSYTVIVNDGSLTSPPQAANITFNAAPVLVNNQLTISQAQTVVLSTSQLSASDDTALASALQFTVSDVQHGQFSLNGMAATSFTQQDITEGKVSFVQDGTATAPSYTVIVSDGDLISSSQAANITFNAAPVLVNNQLTIGQAQTVVLTTSQLSASDDTTPANALQFTVSNVQHGQFRLMGVATTSFTQQNIIDGNVTFVQDGTATAPSYTVSVSDGDLISAPQTASITFNRMPVLSSGNQTISYYSRTAPV